jgi:hypothetical protein
MSAFLVPELSAFEVVPASSWNDSVNEVTEGTYSPTITGTGSNPIWNVGGGFLTGLWWRVGRFVSGSIDFSLTASGTIQGTSWRLSLPFAADVTFHTAGVLDAASSYVGDFQTRSGTAAQTLTGSCLLSAASEIVMYSSGATTSVGNGNFTTTARIKVGFRYVAAAAAF